MSDATNALLELRAKIDANRRLLEKQEAALVVMEEMMGLTASKAAPQTKPLDFYSGGIAITDLNIPEVASKKTFKQELKDVVKLLGSQEFTVAHIHIALTNMGIKVNGKQPRARIANMLGQLEDDGFIIRTYKGNGSVPHKFKLAKP